MDVSSLYLCLYMLVLSAQTPTPSHKWDRDQMHQVGLSPQSHSPDQAPRGGLVLKVKLKQRG